jgi:hypothetical protein
MSERRQGRFLGFPYDWRKPSATRIRKRAWDPDESRILVPKSFGWGYGLNFAALRRRLTGRG